MTVYIKKLGLFPGTFPGDVGFLKFKFFSVNMLETFDSVSKTLVLSSNHASKDFLNKMFKLRSSDLFTDIILSGADEKVALKAHKLVLCCCSPYFEAMFRGHFKESSHETIEIKQVTSQGLSLMIDYFYTGSLLVTPDNVVELLNISDILLLQQVRQK